MVQMPLFPGQAWRCRWRVGLRCVAVGDHGVAARSSDRPSAVVGGRGEAQREGRQTYTQLIHAPEEQRLRQHWEAIIFQ